MLNFMISRNVARLLAIAKAFVLTCTATLAASGTHTSKQFKGATANTGTVTHSIMNGQDILTLSDDFKVPETPAPHWQVVDSAGNVYLLQRLKVKGDMGDRINKSIVVPAYVHEIAKVQIWCAWAETLLGETTFDSTLMTNAAISEAICEMHVTSRFTGVKANTGTVAHNHTGGKSVLTLSDDFIAPDAPAPHWRIIDSNGNAYMLHSLNIKGDKMNRSIVVPSYVPDVAKVQMWCAYAEVVLGEASFESPIR